MKDVPKHQVGGQAVIEGVMMRSKNFWTLAVRRLDKSISVRLYRDVSIVKKYPWLNLALARGAGVMVENLSLGFRALSYSINEAFGEEVNFSRREMIISVSLAILFVVGIFFVLPTLIGRSFANIVSNSIVYNILEGLVRIALFLIYLFSVSWLKDVRRLFQYHGAEHKTIHAYESGEELTPENVEKYSRLHIRCGTNFLLIVMVVAIFVFSLLGKTPILWRVVSRIVLIPVIAGISYELIRLAGKFSKYKIVNIIFYPGLLLQKITTKEPDRLQLEVAISSLKKLIEAEDSLARENSDVVS
ncbi:MAG: DUF1385 domain-containing protein [Actinobacteria bacterium]|nr:DUF1385 domain-containing protein [Actinomycetota bacterium]